MRQGGLPFCRGGEGSRGSDVGVRSVFPGNSGAPQRVSSMTTARFASLARKRERLTPSPCGHQNTGSLLGFTGANMYMARHSKVASTNMSKPLWYSSLTSYKLFAL